MATRTDFVQPQAGSQGFARTGKVFGRRVTFATTDLATNARRRGVHGSGGLHRHRHHCRARPTWTATARRPVIAAHLASSCWNNLGQRLRRAPPVVLDHRTGGTTTQTLASTGLLYNYTTDTKILVTATTGSATAVAGTLDLYLQGFMQ
jgi:hypothetical protein